MPNDRVMRMAFLVSLLGHCVLFSAPGMKIPENRDDKKNIKVSLKIEDPVILPKIREIGMEKKIPELPELPEESVPEEPDLKEPDEPPEEQPEEKELEDVSPELPPAQEVFKAPPETPTPEPPEQAVPEPSPQPRTEKIAAPTTPPVQDIEKPPPLPMPTPQPVPAVKELSENVVKDKNFAEKVKVPHPDTEKMLRYQDAVKQRIQSARRYPRWARRHGVEGAVGVSFLVLSDGSSKNIRLTRSSGYKILDEEALATIKRAGPFPPIPEKNIPRTRIHVSIVFNLQ